MRSLPETSTRLPADAKTEMPRPASGRRGEHRDAERAALGEEAEPTATRG